ncbi:MAG: SDR family NAD(P)-dependent oxidoreductase [Actinobacteria bacterium]|nr:SDR family NAD(P)-dependent oxidoreductase [Actinomycetota bacterium]MBU1942591.1 SDR family NAD(P)-dependent oxidoreductase [Actinomycetota bacterium]MBU2688733.1 SDR family NAD(P)-dependent oxidoreductase [Actinomycetota bacterium]
MDDFRGKVVVVTGAASGLGAEVARSFARRGARLELCDVDGEGLGEIKTECEAMGAEVSTEVVDVSQAWQMEEFRDNVLKRCDHVDVVVNNAGVACGGRFEDISLENWQWIVGVNYWGVVHGCHFFYPGMKERGSGHIVNIASAAAYGPLPLLTTYCSLKAAVLSFSANLRAEGALCGVGISAVCPGFMSTSIARSMRFCSETRRSNREKLGGKVDRFMTGLKASPSRAAESVVRAVERNRFVINVGPETKLADFIWRLSRRLNVVGLKYTLRFLEKRL